MPNYFVSARNVNTPLKNKSKIVLCIKLSHVDTRVKLGESKTRGKSIEPMRGIMPVMLPSIFVGIAVYTSVS